MKSEGTAARSRLPFRAVNRAGHDGYTAGMQRHHLLPCQLLSRRSFNRLFAAVGVPEIGFDDFRRNGLLLPASDEAALRIRLPLHRGPHRAYTAVVAERVGQIEDHWSRSRPGGEAARDALLRLRLLQGALRRRLLNAQRRPLQLNSRDPLGSGLDFAELDAMAELIWAGTGDAAPSSW